MSSTTKCYCRSLLLSWCLFVVMNSSTTFGIGTPMKKSRFFEVLKPTPKTGVWESEEERKSKALGLCINHALDARQRKMCLKFPLQVAAVFRAYGEAVDECQYQFRNERWNCSSLVSMSGKTMQPLVTKLMTRGFKEVAFVHALIAAAVAKAVSLDCARGAMTSCGRTGSKRRLTKKEYINYDEAITHGIYFSEKFLNSGKSSHDVQGIVNRHNLRAGRLVFTDNLKTMCKCHGMSGSCSSKTCLKKAAGLREIGKTIKAMYLQAKKVEPKNEQRSGLKLVVVDREESPSKSELLYIENSPSFCDRDGTLGTQGVAGRVCSKDPSHVNSCRTMCCGRGYHEVWYHEDTDCECTFKWCCSVKCKKCHQDKWVAVCK